MPETLTGYVGEIKGRSFLNMKLLTEFIKDEVETEPIGDETPVSRVEKIVRLYMLVNLGGILFPNSSGNEIRLHFLEFLDPIGATTYSWGSVVYFTMWGVI